MDEDIAREDHRKRRCPMLGHEVGFAYCRAPGRPLPCRKILDCWHETFDVEGFVRRHFSEEEIARILAPPKAKMASLVELIAKARKAAQDPPG